MRTYFQHWNTPTSSFAQRCLFTTSHLYKPYFKSLHHSSGWVALQKPPLLIVELEATQRYPCQLGEWIVSPHLRGRVEYYSATWTALLRLYTAAWYLLLQYCHLTNQSLQVWPSARSTCTGKCHIIRILFGSCRKACGYPSLEYQCSGILWHHHTFKVTAL